MGIIEGYCLEIPEIEAAFAQVGTGGTMSFGGNPGNLGSLTIQLVPLNERERSVWDVIDELRDKTQDIAGAEINVSAMDTMALGSTVPLDIAIKGDDLDQLQQIAADFEKIVASVEGTREVQNSMSEGIPEVQVMIDRDRASQYGLTAYQIASGLRGTLSGTTATTYRYEGKEINVVIKGDKTFKESLTNLGQTPLSTPFGTSVPLSQVAEVTIQRGPIAIERVDQARVIHVSSDIVDRDLTSVTDEIQAKLADYPLPSGYSYDLGGEYDEVMEAFTDLALALMLAIVLVYMILAAQFESLIHPFTVIFSLPMGFSGGLLGLLITGYAVSVPAFIGMILLVGIVVSNAIVLVDYINKRREMGEDRDEAIKQAGPIRLRPSIMTTLTTLLGLVPMALAIGEGAELMAPMAIVVVFGLLLSTVSTLILVPVIYTLNEDMINFFKRLGKKKNTPPTIPPNTPTPLTPN